MVRYDALLASLARGIERGGARHSSHSLSLETLSACREALLKAFTATHEAGMESDNPARPHVPPHQGKPQYGHYLEIKPDMAPHVTQHALHILTTHPYRRTFLSYPQGDRIVLNAFTCRAAFTDAANLAALKDLVATMLMSASKKEMTTAHLILSAQILTWFASPNGTTAEDPMEEHTEREQKRPALTSGIPTSTAAAFLTAVREVVSRLQTTGPSSTSKCPRVERLSDALENHETHGARKGRSFQRRRVASSPPSAPTQVAAAAHPNEATGQRLDVDGDGEFGVRAMYRSSSKNAVSNEELSFLLSSVLVGRWAVTSSSQEAQELVQLTEIIAHHFIGRRLLSREPDDTRPPNVATLHAGWRLLHNMTCRPHGVPALEAYGVSTMADYNAHPATHGLRRLALQDQTRLRQRTIRSLLHYSREARSGAGDGTQTKEVGSHVLRLFSAVLLPMMRDAPAAVESADSETPASSGTYARSVHHLDVGSRVALFFLLCRVYSSHLVGVYRTSQAGPSGFKNEGTVLTLHEVNELHALTSELEKVLWEPLPARSPLEEPDLRAMELAVLQFITHSRSPASGGGVHEDLLEKTATFLTLPLETLVRFHDWDWLLTALSLWLLPKHEGGAATSAQHVKEAAAVARDAVCVLTTLITSDATQSASPACGTSSHANYEATVPLLLSLQRLWNTTRRAAMEQSEELTELRHVIRALLQACLLAAKPNVTSAEEDGVAGTRAEHRNTGPSGSPGVTAAALNILMRMDSADADSNTPDSMEPAIPSTQLPRTILKDTVARSLEQFHNTPSHELQPFFPLYVFEATLNMFHLGVSDPSLLDLAAATIRHTCTVEVLIRVPWKTRCVLLRRCLQLYQMVEPHFSTQSGCRRIGQQCLVVPTRLCLEKCKPVVQKSAQEGQSEADAGTSEAACAVVVWNLCVTAVEKPLRKSSLDKYLPVLTRFVRRHWAEPPSAFLAASLSAQGRCEVVDRLESKLCVSVAAPFRHHAAARTTTDSSDATVGYLDDLVEYNTNLLRMARQPARLTFAILREEREVRARKVKRYYEIYFTLAYLLLRHPSAVAPSVWKMASLHALNFPRVFAASGQFTLMLQKLLEVSAREILRYADRHNNEGQWAGGNNTQDMPHLHDAATTSQAGVETSFGPSPLLTPIAVSRIVYILGSLQNVEARLTALKFASETLDLTPDSLLSFQPIRARGSGSAEDAIEDHEGEEGGYEDGEHLPGSYRHAEREEVLILTQIINGLRAAGRRARRL